MIAALEDGKEKSRKILLLDRLRRIIKENA